MFDLQTLLFLGWVPGTFELIIVAAVFLLLFGGQKLPGLMRNLGRSVNEFKTGIREKPADANLEDKTD